MSDAPQPESKIFDDPVEALNYANRIYHAQIGYIGAELEHYVTTGVPPEQRVSGYYPELVIEYRQKPGDRLKHTRQAYGTFAHSGIFSTTLADPFDALNYDYYIDNLRRIKSNYPDIQFEVRLGSQRIPAPYAAPLVFGQLTDVKSGMDVHAMREAVTERLYNFNNHFDSIPIEDITAIERPPGMNGGSNGANGNGELHHYRLARYTGLDKAWARSKRDYYCGDDGNIGRLHILTYNNSNILHTLRLAAGEMLDPATSRNVAIIGPGGNVLMKEGDTKLDEQMFYRLLGSCQNPAFNIVTKGGETISIIKFGGNSIDAEKLGYILNPMHPTQIFTGQVATTRPDLLVGMLQLCTTYSSGVMNEGVPAPGIVPAPVGFPLVMEMQQTVEQAFKTASGLTSEEEIKSVLRRGSATSVDDRHWEIRGALREAATGGHSISADMDTNANAKVAQEGETPFVALHVVSDDPGLGLTKTRGLSRFIDEHIVPLQAKTAYEAMHALAAQLPIQSRQLRSKHSPPFR